MTRHPVTGTRHPHHPEHVHRHDAVMEHEHRQAHPPHPLAFHYPHERGISPLPHEGSHAQRRAAIIERGRLNHPSYVKSYREHGERFRKMGLLK
jgi:hypothetical protein